MRAPTGRVLILQGQSEHLPAGVDVADAPLVTDANIAVEGDVRSLTGQRPNRLRLEPVGVQRHQKHCEALVLWLVGASPCKQEDVVGDVTVGGEHL